MQKFDVVVIGGGPGGYVAAIRCAQLGLSTACVDERLDKGGKPVLGGTCLNVGCIPSKALLDSTSLYQSLANVKDHGIEVGELRLDLGAMIARKDRVVQTLTAGVAGLLRKHKVSWLKGHGRLAGQMRVEIVPSESEGTAGTVEADHIIIATGSEPAPLDVAPVDGERIIDSTGALDLTEVPGRLGVIGAGVIGLELGSVWRRLGAEVVVLEALDSLLPAVDTDLGREAARQFRRQGVDIRLGARVTAVEHEREALRVAYEDAAGAQALEVDRLIVAVGRHPHTVDLGAEAAGLSVDERGFIDVDERCRTALPRVYAIGDVVRGPMLAHKASEEAIMVAECIAGQHGEVNYGAVPWVIYTAPEIAWVGETEQAARARGAKVRSGRFPLTASGRARAMGETAGLVKVVADADTDRVLGVHLLGPHVSELLGEAVLALEFAASSEDIARTIHAHPTLSEALHEAALAVDGRPIHI